MERTLIRNVMLVDGDVRAGNLLLEEGKILAVLPAGFAPPAPVVVDGKGLYASAGLIELHTHGAGGHDFMDGTPEAYEGACEMHLKHGVTTILPTTVASSDAEYRRTIDSFRQAQRDRSQRQCLLGMHFEGPYFPPQRAGGMDPDYIMPPRRQAYLELMDYGSGCIARWTAAPELPGAERFAADCLANGILPSIGHTDATIRDVRRAMEAGFRHVTHLYSDMSTVTRESGFRVPGVLECAFLFDELWVEVIADGCHMPPDLMQMIYRLIGPERLQLCSDSIRPAGTGEAGEVIVGSLENGVRGVIEDGVAKMPDRTSFAGSVASGDRVVRTMRDLGGAPLHEAVAMMTANPARLLGLADRKGGLRPGMDADLILFDGEVSMQTVWVGGECVFSADEK